MKMELFRVVIPPAKPDVEPTSTDPPYTKTIELPEIVQDPGMRLKGDDTNWTMVVDPNPCTRAVLCDNTIDEPLEMVTLIIRKVTILAVELFKLKLFR